MLHIIFCYDIKVMDGMVEFNLQGIGILMTLSATIHSLFVEKSKNSNPSSYPARTKNL